MNRPQLYNVFISNCPGSDPVFLEISKTSFRMTEEEFARFSKEIVEKRRSIAVCAPLDIAKTLSDTFIATCRTKPMSVKVDFQLSGKYE